MNLEIVVDYLKKHFYQYSSQYIFVIVIFIMGVIFGSILVNNLSYAQKNDLYEYLSQFFFYVNTEELLTFKELFTQTVFHHLKSLLVFFLLGISIIGLPVILVILFIKGIVVGFTVGFLVNQLHFQGFVVSLLSIFPQNIIIVPVFLIASVLTINFSIKLIKKLFTNNPNMLFLPITVNYIKGFFVLILLVIVAAAIEAVCSTHLLKWILNLI